MKTLIFDLDGTLVRLQPSLMLIADVARLEELRKQYMFALVTGSPRREVEYALAETNMRKLFDDEYIVTAEDTKGNKASGEPFLAIKKLLQGDGVMVGDSPSDQIGSDIAQIPFIFVETAQTLDDQRKFLKIAIDRAIAAVESSA